MSIEKKSHDITTIVESCTTLPLTRFFEANSPIAQEEAAGVNKHNDDAACFGAVWARVEGILARHTHLIASTGAGKESEQDAAAEKVGADRCVPQKDNSEASP